MKFLNAKKSNDLLEVTVSYEIEGKVVDVIWSAIDVDGGFSTQFYISDVHCNDAEFEERMKKAVEMGEADDNPDLEIYLFILQTFDAFDCFELECPSFEGDVTDVRLFVYSSYHRVNYVINDCFIIQSDSKTNEFVIPDSSDSCWDSIFMQNQASSILDPDELAERLELKTEIRDVLEEYTPYLFGDEEEIEKVKR